MDNGSAGGRATITARILHGGSEDLLSGVTRVYSYPRTCQEESASLQLPATHFCGTVAGNVQECCDAVLSNSLPLPSCPIIGFHGDRFCLDCLMFHCFMERE